MPELHKRITRSFTDTPRILSMPSLKKNLIVIQVESFERSPIGYYNSRFPENMPFMSGLAANHTVADNIDSQPYTTWTASGVFLTHCGYPQIIRDPLYWENRRHSHITALNRIPCYPTFLKLAGYDMYSFCVGSNLLMGISQFFQDRGYVVQTGSEIGINHDWDLVEHCGEILRKLANSSKPFLLHMSTEDTHPMYFVDSRCNTANLLPGKEDPVIIRSFNCLDQSVQWFVELCRSLGLDQNTEIVIHSDHICWGAQKGIYDSRKLIVLFPFRPPRRITKPSTYYDIAPTILDIPGLQYSPPFPFGASLFSDAVGRFPKDVDFQFMHNLYSKYTRQSGNITCGQKAGFCTGYM
jgi:phosphoglycerol transferase MdoB-like AlkP superfamily enzyme